LGAVHGGGRRQGRQAFGRAVQRRQRGGALLRDLAVLVLEREPRLHRTAGRSELPDQGILAAAVIEADGAVLFHTAAVDRAVRRVRPVQRREPATDRRLEV